MNFSFFKKIKLNIGPILKLSAKLAGTLFSISAILLAFVSWEDLKLTDLTMRISVLLAIPAASFLFSLICVVAVLKNKQLWANGKNKVLAFYGDLLAIAKNKEKKIVAIPVNDTFETIVDDDLSTPKPLVSPNTIHGQWIKMMIDDGFSTEELNDMIRESLQRMGAQKKKTYSNKDKSRGNRDSYPLGTVAMINGKGNTTYYLVAISAFDSNNKASSSRKNVRDCVDELFDVYDKNGQGYPIYIPLFGTGRSRADLKHQQAFNLIKNEIMTNEMLINGVVNIVVYKKDKDKVSIFK